MLLRIYYIKILLVNLKRTKPYLWKKVKYFCDVINTQFSNNNRREHTFIKITILK